MSEPEDTAPAPAPVQALKRSVVPKALIAVGLTAALMFAAVFAITRYGVLLPQARLMIEARTDGLKIGRFGRLNIEGLQGDVWRDFTIQRLTVSDEKGVWLEADDVHVIWRYAALLRRRFHADRIDAETVHILRRPTLTPKGADTGNPVAFYIDEAHAQVEMLPAFSYRRGLYDVALSLSIPRSGGSEGVVQALSLLHPGDHLNLDFDFRRHKPLLVRADGEEAQGGALAGALGFPANQSFSLKITADGKAAAGRFAALAATGPVQPLVAQGVWTPEGGQISGRLLLTASTLTQSYARRFGPEVAFVGSGRKASGGFFALEGQATAENLKLSASGLGDIGARKLGPQGLAVDAETGALSRITGGPQIGPARIAGRLTQSAAGWRFAGTMAASRLSLGGYSLAQASGPLEVTAGSGGLTLKGGLSSSGGRGAGWIAAILGGAPRADVEAERLPDGRLVLRTLQVLGRGLKLQASGGRGLLGTLSFKGRADITNLAAAHAGASGSAVATWSAGQGGAGKPWTFGVTASGERFATGYPEFDRLVGGRPKLTVEANWQDRRLAVGRAVLNGAALRLASAGVLDRDGALKFKLDWSASGPFHAGPVEVGGKASGAGALTGTLGSPRADLMADVALIDVPRLPLKNAHLTLSFLRRPDGSSGMIAATAESAYGPARGRSDFRFAPGGVDLTGVSIDAGGLKASGDLSLRKSAPSAADLTLAVSRGAFLDAGRIAGTVRIVDASGGPRAALDLTGEGARLPGSDVVLTSAHVTADGPLAHLPYAAEGHGLSGAGPWSLDGRGSVSQLSPGYSTTFEGSGKLGGRALRTVEPAVIRFGGGERDARLRLAAADGGRIAVDGRLTGALADVQAQLTGVSLTMANEDLTGRMDATLRLEGRGSQLAGTLEAKLTGARGRGEPAASGVDSVVHARLGGGEVTLDATATNGQGLRANASLALPAASSAAPFRIAVAREQPMHGRFFAQGEVRPLFDLLVGGERSLSGQVQTEGTLGGSLAEPRIAGQISVANGRFDDGGAGLSLRQVAMRADFAQDGVQVIQASGVDGHGGSVTGAGRISLARNGVSSFRLDLHGFRLIDNEQATASATGEATIARGADGRVKLSGALTVDRADVAAELPESSAVVSMDVVERNRPESLPASLPPPQARGRGWDLDVALRAPRRVFLRGRGLNVELSLDAHVGGTTSQPDLSGTARVVGGSYDFAGKRFEFDPSSVVYLSTHAAAIRLDLLATREDPTLTANVRIRGTAARPEITLSSTPALPSDEVLSEVLFGTSAAQLSPIEAAQLASAVASLTHGGGFDVVGNLRAFAHLDRLAMGGGSAGQGVTVSGGKYLTDNVYIEVTGGARQGPSADVEWRVRRNLSIVSQIGGLNGAKLSVRWRRDY